MNEEEKKLLEANLGGLEMYRKGFQDGWLTNPQNPDNTANAEVRRQLLEQEILHWDRRLIAIFESLISLHDKKMVEKIDKAISNSAAEFFIKINGGGNGRRIMIQYEGYLRELAAQVIEGKESQ